MKLTITFLLIFAHSFIFSQLPSYVPKNGLVGYWPFDGNANDYSGNNNNGVVKGATLITGRTGIASTAYNFNGNDNTIEVSHNTILNLDTAFSINLWVKLPASQVNNPASYVSKYSLSQKSGFVFPYINEGVSGFGLNLTTENGTTENAAGQGQYLTSQIANKTSWHQFTAVFSNGNYKLYVDGFIVKTNSGLGNTLVNNTNNLIFGNSTGYNQFAKGGLDEVGIWNRSLTENEIIALNGCVAPITTIAANASTNICPGSSVALSANSGSNFTYQWYRNDTIIQGATSISYTASNMGSYAVIVKSGPCPTKSSPIQVSFQLPNNLPYNPFSDTVKSCINDVVLDAGAGFTKYEWGDNSINQKLTVKEPGFHKVKITYGNNCVAFDSTYVDLIVQAKIRANDTTICYRNELLLTNEPSINNVRYLKYNVYSSDYNYFGVNELEVFVNGVNIAKNKKIYSNAGWGPELANDGNQTTGWGSSSYHFFQVSPTTPHILMIDLGVLSNLDSVKLRTSSTGAYWSKQNISLMTSIDSLNWKLVARTTLTDGEVFKPTFYNGYTYKWYKNDNLISSETNRIFHVKNPGVYKLEISKNNCTSISKSINVKYDNPPTEDGEYDVFQDSLISCGKDLVLDAGVGYKSYFWSDSLKTQTKTVTKSGSYSAIVQYGINGCKAKDSVYVEVIKSELNHKDTTICFENSVLLKQSNKRSSIRYIKFESYASADASQVNVYEIEVYSKGINVALGKNTTVNSGGGGSSIVDGNGYSRWSSSRGDFGGPSKDHPHFIIVDLGSEYDFSQPTDRIVVNIDGFDHWKQSFSVLASSDNNTWFKIGGEDDKTGIFTYILGDINLLGYNYQWYKNNTPISSAIQYNYTASESGNYTLKVTKGSCEVTSAPVKITVESPTVNNTAYNPFQDSIVSCGKDLVLDAGIGFKSYLWNDSLKTQTKTITKSGSYSATVEYGTIGCKAKDSVFVDVVKSVLNQKDTTICFGNSVRLTNKETQPGIRFVKMEVTSSTSDRLLQHIEVISNGANVALDKAITANKGWGIEQIVRQWAGNGWWTPGTSSTVTDPSYFTLDLGKVYETTSKINSLSFQLNSTLNYNVYTSADNINWIKIISENQASGTKTYNLDGLNLYETIRNYQWYKNNNPISSATQYTYTASESGSYTLKVTKGSCEVTSAPVKITVESPTINNTAYNPFQDSIISCGKDLVLDAGVGYKSYLWNDSLKTQTKTITKSGSYSATVEYGTIGCKAKDSVFVDVVKSVLNQKDTTICFGNSVRLTNKETQPGIRFVKMEVTSSTSDRLLQHIEVISNGANVALDKAITANKGWGIEEIVRQWAGNGWWTPGTSSTVTDPSYFTLDLGKVYETTIKINSLSFQLNSTLNYNVYTSADNINWIKIISENQASGTKTYNLDGLNLYETIRNYQWYKNTTPISSATQYTYIVSESGSYRLKVTKGSCEVTSAPVNITVESPTVNNTAYNPFQDSIVSCGKDLVLDAGVGYKSYFWSDSLKTQTKTITKSGSYSATVEYGTIGCKAKDSVFVDVVKSGLNQKDTTICFGNSVSMKQSNKRSSLRYIKFESYASADANQVNVYEIEAYSKGMNVALGKNTIVNSGGGGFSVVDGNGYSRWSSNRGDFGGPSKDHPHFIIVDLGSEYDFNQPTDRIVVNIDGFDHWKQTFSVLVSSDNNTWLKIGNEDDKTGMFTYTLGEVSLPGYNYQWYNDNNLISNANQYFYEAKESGTYTLKVKKGNCEVTSIPVKITVDSPSKLPFNPIQDTLVACNQDVVLDAGVGFSSYAWSDGKTISMDTIKKSGNYSITVSFGKNGCTLSDQGFIQVIKPTLNLSDSILVCNTNDSKFLSAIDTTYSIGYSYQWYKDGNKLLSETKKYITTNTLGSYQLELSKDKCILKSKPLIIYVITTPPNPLSDSLIGCGNPIVLDVSKYSNIIWSIPGDKGNYSNYNPKITTDYSGLYSVQFTYRSCPFSDRVVVSNLIPNVQLERQVGSTSLLNILCGDEQIKIVNTISNSNFLNPQGTRYDWYKNSSLLPNHFDNILVSDSGIYTLKLKYKSCTTTSDTIRLSKKVLPSNALYFSNTLNLCEGANVTVKALADGTYKWSTGSTNQSILLTSAQKGTYFVNITDKNGCVAKSDTFSIVDKTVPSVNICMVTTLNNKNLLIWNNDLSDIATLAKYRIYKQNSTNSTYDMIHEQSITDLSEYVDSTSQPSQQIARYKLSIIDSCGNEKISSNHTTMLLTSNLGVNGTVNLLWNPYEGFVYDNFEIWRSENGVDYVKLDQVSNNTFSYIDNNPPASCFYQLRIENKMGCNSSKRGSYSSVRSNIIDKNGKSLSVSDNIELTELVKLFPNPSSGLFTLTNIPLDAHLTFMDVTGKEIMKLNTFDRKIDVDLSKLVDNGVYFLKVQSIYQEDQIINFNIIK